MVRKTIERIARTATVGGLFFYPLSKSDFLVLAVAWPYWRQIRSLSGFASTTRDPHRSSSTGIPLAFQEEAHI